MFAWDKARRRASLRKHGIDSADAATIFRGITITAADDREAHGERRFLALGLLEDQVIPNVQHRPTLVAAPLACASVAPSARRG